MELRHLAGFIATAEELHFGRAAARLHMAQPALSQQIRLLEKELGVELFHRNTRSVSLTDSGKAMLGPAKQVMADVDIARRSALFGSSEIVGRVVVGFAGASSRNVLPVLARAVRAEQPGIELVLKGQTYAGKAVAEVAAGQLDIGFARLPVNNQSVATRVYEYERMVAALPSDHPLAGRETIRIADLASEPFVTFPGTQGSTVRDALIHVAMGAGFTPRIMQEAPDSYTILGLVAAGVGVTITVSSVQHIDTPGLVYRELEDDLPRIAAVLAWRKENSAAATNAVLEIAERLLPTPAASEH
ncbi:LysR family transcriptional regulator [Pseudarthrobacter enclensis]|uniref:DNA-binding transcriptional LysR family regulator n=1 Tax=Pseudarthrobacter enclensis TaxID=993070 RepID=A0ABT9RY37_9MICC|nr:LysR family transcriptional regulator [Pseudarthrobacter enclensis]MDP9889977.1 DNA-binding transcriptional LysR family regulator [Pseudarthrobacter enclensis]